MFCGGREQLVASGGATLVTEVTLELIWPSPARVTVACTRRWQPLSAVPTLWARPRAVIELGGGRPPRHSPLGGGRIAYEGAHLPLGLELGSFWPHSHDLPVSPALSVFPRRPVALARHPDAEFAWGWGRLRNSVMLRRSACGRLRTPPFGWPHRRAVRRHRRRPCIALALRMIHEGLESGPQSSGTVSAVAPGRSATHLRPYPPPGRTGSRSRHHRACSWARWPPAASIGRMFSVVIFRV
jgi:hypothetical protein